jgi:hypothetical protein
MNILSGFQDWVWGLSLVGLTIAIHATGVVVMGITGMRFRTSLEKRALLLRHEISILIGLIGAGGLLLAALHGVEAALWAACYVWVGAIESPADAMLYSVDSMTTRGAIDLVLPRRWQMMGALESADGMLLFGISTAFMFAVIQARWPTLIRALDYSAAGRHSRNN